MATYDYGAVVTSLVVNCVANSWFLHTGELLEVQREDVEDPDFLVADYVEVPILPKGFAIVELRSIENLIRPNIWNL